MLLTANVASEGALVLDSAIEPTLTSSTSSSSLLKASAVLTSTRSFILYHAKALLGLYGDVLYWVGAYNLADTHSWEATPTRDALYVIVGFAVFFLVSLWTWKQRTQPQPGRRAGAGDRGGDWTPLAEEGQGGQQSMGGGLGDRMVFYARLMVTMVAGILAWVGWWNILSTWVVTDSSAVADAEEPTAEDADVGGLSQRTFRTLSRHSQHHPTSSLPHLWTLMQRSSTAESSFPMWVLYALYAFTGLVLLGVTNTFTGQAGVIQPLGLIRQQANVGVNAAGTREEERGVEGGPGREHPNATVEATPALSHAVPSL